ncbi:MAG: AraC family transcriptional regulator [Opitutales bacterium]|nr:AraC family transcriptional regulator [Opitutales bacterium]
MLTKLSRSVQRINPPASLFKGVSIADGFAPDNIVVFKRTDPAELVPAGVSHNYHHRFVFLTLIRGAGRVRVGSRSHALVPGESILIFPFQFHHFMDLDGDEIEWLFITFESLVDVRIQALKDTPKVNSERSIKLLESFIQHSSDFRSGKVNLYDSLLLAVELAEILQRMISLKSVPKNRQATRSKDENRDHLLESINAYIRDHLHSKFTLDDLAEELKYSASHLRAVFRESIGLSLGRYIRESQLSHAAQLLQTSQLSVSEIAERCGFQSVHAFSRAFKSTYGVGPKVYSQGNWDTSL